MTDSPLVSIVIRARDEERSLRRLLPLLQAQRADFAFEVWLLDNGSRDGTAALAQAAGLRYHHIPRDAFNYAAALNLGATLAEGEIVVNLSAHCFPQSSGWLAALVAPLRRDQAVVASYGRQWTNPAVAPFEAMGNDTLFPPAGREPEIVAFSNANSALRRAHLLVHPFNPAVKILEDHLFLLELQGAGRVEYAPEALVHHEHESFSWRYNLRRWVREGWAFYFITRHRGLGSPFAPRRLVDPRHLFVDYPYQAAAYLRRGRLRLALLTLPFFWLRDLTWAAAFLRAARAHEQIARADAEHLLQIARELWRRELASPSDSRATLDWPEEWRLKGDWSFIRRNIADFIRSCHERGLLASPLLEVGASGQNDYLGEWYQLITTNLATNMQGAAAPLDMEDMRDVADASLGSLLCSEVIEHVRHPDRAFAEAFRVLRPGGTLVVTTPYSIVIHDTPDDGGFHGRNFTPQGLALVAEEAGFAVEVLETRGATDVRRRLLPSNVFLVARKPAAHQ